MKTATLDRSFETTPVASVATVGARSIRVSTTASTRKPAVLVGAMFLVATFAFAIGNAVIHSYFSNAAADTGTLIVGLCFLGCVGLAVATNGLAMRRILTSHTPIRSRAYLCLRAAECASLVAVGAYFLTSRSQWSAYLLPIYFVSGAAGLVLSSALLTSKLVPRKLSMLGVIGYPIFLAGSIFAMFNLIDVTRGAGMLALVPGGLFELILPIWLFTKGFALEQIEGR